MNILYKIMHLVTMYKVRTSPSTQEGTLQIKYKILQMRISLLIYDLVM